MANPTPLQSFIGGLAIPVAAHELLLLNGNVFGISGFIHRAVKGSIEGLAGAAGLVIGGFIISKLEGGGPSVLSLPFPYILFSGFLVGLGTKLANGCTSGHMVCGISRFSLRSIAATATFFTTGVMTTQVFHRDLPAIGPTDWTIHPSAKQLLLLQAIPLSLSALLYTLGRDVPNSPRSTLRVMVYFATGVQFALAVRVSNLTEASRVLGFLILPFHHAFDPSLAFLAASALPVGIVLYRYARGQERPRLGGKWSIPKGGDINSRLLIGSSIFGVGWGLAGICPGPGLVNFGRALTMGGQNAFTYASWLGALIIGGLLA
ncbi:hypothetical protein M413DRAFT_15174 [Hebeloma cylindrosporum]|uniref:Uncharacterized protein n=1 Tax=Hebeloma cylindrosporum TaxID=76867 RepID=A0A0C3CYK2_HEBCY|nr:hypothetical protein M413DRAFT_15174 [Hebeloma cylindrosporum h7]